MFKQVSIFIAFLFLFTQVNAQDKEPLPRFSIRGSCAIPKIIGSEAFRISFLGVYDANLTFNFRLGKKLTLGIGYQNCVFNQTATFKNKGLDTRLQVHNGLIRLGFDKFTSPKSFASLSITSGYGLNKYTAVKAVKDSLNGKYPTFFTATFLRPEASINFLVEDNFAFGILIAYNMVLSSYDPNLNCFATYESFSKYRNKVNMGWISFGFNFFYAPQRKKAAN